MCGINGVFAYGYHIALIEAIGDGEILFFVDTPPALQCFLDG
jgi:hypothetical protein